ncbi:GNAT family N-acetyltransferase [Vibrio breoganii]
MNIVGEKVKLRAIEKSDLNFLLELINSPELESYVVGSSVPLSSIQQSNWIENTLNSNCAIRLIVENELGESIGFVNLVDINFTNRVAIHGVKFLKKHRGKGYAKDSVLSLMRYAFNTLNLNRLESTIIDYNAASISLYTKSCGWEIEGNKKQAVYKNGDYHDLIVIGITKDTYNDFIKKRDFR